MNVLQVRINGKDMYIPLEWAQRMCFLMIPEWLRDSRVDPPENPDKGSSMSKMALMAMRSTLKNVSRPFLPTLFEAVYHQPLKLGRGDSLPVISGIIIDFILSKIMQHPMEIQFNEQTGLVEQIRPVLREITFADHPESDRGRELQAEESSL